MDKALTQTGLGQITLRRPKAKENSFCYSKKPPNFPQGSHKESLHRTSCFDCTENIPCNGPDPVKPKRNLPGWQRAECTTGGCDSQECFYIVLCCSIPSGMHGLCPFDLEYGCLEGPGFHICSYFVVIFCLHPKFLDVILKPCIQNSPLLSFHLTNS